MVWGEGHRWSVTVDVPKGEVLEYKYVVLQPDGVTALHWQQGNNAVLALLPDEARLEVFDDWYDPSSSSVITAAGRSTRSDRLAAWAAQMTSMAGCLRNELRAARIAEHEAYEGTKAALQEAAKAQEGLTAQVQMNEQMAAQITQVQENNRRLRLQLLESQTLFQEVMAEARDIILSSLGDTAGEAAGEPAADAAGGGSDGDSGCVEGRAEGGEPSSREEEGGGDDGEGGDEGASTGVVDSEGRPGGLGGAASDAAGPPPAASAPATGGGTTARAGNSGSGSASRGGARPISSKVHDSAVLSRGTPLSEGMANGASALRVRRADEDGSVTFTFPAQRSPGNDGTGSNDGSSNVGRSGEEGGAATQAGRSGETQGASAGTAGGRNGAPDRRSRAAAEASTPAVLGRGEQERPARAGGLVSGAGAESSGRGNRQGGLVSGAGAESPGRGDRQGAGDGGSGFGKGGRRRPGSPGARAASGAALAVPSGAEPDAAALRRARSPAGAALAAAGPLRPARDAAAGVVRASAALRATGAGSGSSSFEAEMQELTSEAHDLLAVLEQLEEDMGEAEDTIRRATMAAASHASSGIGR